MLRGYPAVMRHAATPRAGARACSPAARTPGGISSRAWSSRWGSLWKSRSSSFSLGSSQPARSRRMTGPTARQCSSARKRSVSSSTIFKAAGSSWSRWRRLPRQNVPQVVDGIEVNARPIADRRLEVARYGQIQDEQWPAAPGGLHREEVGRRDNRPFRPGRADHQIGCREGLQPAMPWHPLALPLLGQGLCLGKAPVHHGHLADALVAEILERLFGHFSGAENQRLLVVEPLKESVARSR